VGSLTLGSGRCRWHWGLASAGDRAADRRTSDAERLGELGGGVLAGAMKLDKERFLALAELGLLAAEPALGLGYAHALAGADPDQAAFELGDHGQDIE
jgi:hypothetical protein